MAILIESEKDQTAFVAVKQVCDQIESQTPVRFTEETRVLITNTLQAILDDPSPEWIAVDPPLLSSKHKQMMDNLSTQLTEMIKDLPNYPYQSGPVDKITYFQALHWLSKKLDKLCPFQKDPWKP